MKKFFVLSLVLISVSFAFLNLSSTLTAKEPTCLDGLPDPLQDVDLLAPFGEVVAAWDTGNSPPRAKVYDVTQNLEFAPDRWIDGGSGLAGDRGLDVATAEFNGDDQDEFAWIWRSNGWTPDLELSVVSTSTGAPPTSPCGVIRTGEYVYGDLAVATGDFDGDRIDEVVIAWEGADRTANVKIYDVSEADLCPHEKDKDYEDNLEPDGLLDMATGDVDGDAADEVVLLWEGESKTVSLKLYDVSPTFVLEPIAEIATDYTSGGEHLALAMGDFDNDLDDEVAVVWEQQRAEDDKVFATLKVYDVEPGLDGVFRFISKGRMLFNDAAVDAIKELEMRTGDFDDNGDAEIVFGFSGIEAEETKVSLFVVDVISSYEGEDWRLSLEDYEREVAIYGEMDIDLAVGNLDDKDLDDEIVLALEGELNKLCLALYDTGQDDTTKFQLERRPPICDPEESLGGEKHLAIDTGNLFPDGFRLGPRTAASPQRVTAQHIIARIGEPPKHHDLIDGEERNINDDGQSFVRYTNEQEQSTEMELTTWTDKGLSVELEGSYYKFIKILDWRFGLHWEHHHEETISRIRRQRFGREVFAQRDDVLIRIENEYAVWEYPVYSDYDPEESKEPIGYISVVVPLGQPRTAVINGKNAAVYKHYLPFHENGNVLSYPTSFPTNTIQTCIRCEDTFYVGVNPISTWVTWADVMRASQTASSSLTFELGIDPAIPLVFPVPIIGGIGVIDIEELSGSYSHGQITNHAISFLEESSIFLHLAPIENENQSYAVWPYFYWDTTGALVVDYETTPVLAPGGFPETWWQSVYTRPNLTFNLPWRWEDDDRRELSKEIFFEPATVPLNQTQTVTITARVHNYSLTSAESVAVSFYQQDPFGPFQPIGEDQVIEQIPGRGTAIVTTTAEIHVTTPDQLMSEVKRETRAILSTAGIVADADQHRIYIEVDPASQQPPYGAVQETNESDNRAYRNLVIKAATAQKGDAYITADDISFQRIENELIKLEANVHAEEGPVAYVLVEFYDGNPQQTGKFIGAVEIPLILPGESELAQIPWDVAGQYGDHDIHAVIVFNGEEETNPDNNVASKVIHIAPYYSQVYLPLVLRSPR